MTPVDPTAAVPATPASAAPPPVFALPVEFGKAREFAAATCAAHPVWFDDALARARGLPGVPVVPVYVMATEHYAPRALIGADGLPGGVRSLYGQMEFDYHRPIHAGDTLIVRPGAVSVTHKQGRRGGVMTLTTTETLFEKDGALALVRRGTRIETGVEVSTIPAARPAVVAAAADAFASATTVRLDDGVPPAPPRAAAVKAGLVVLREVTIDRVRIARYAGASGDFAPIHLDDAVARQFGNASVFAHGMLSGGIMATLLADWLGPASLRFYRARFVGRVFPGDRIAYRVLASALEADAGGTRLHCRLRASNQDGVVVLEGSALAVLPD